MLEISLSPRGYNSAEPRTKNRTIRSLPEKQFSGAPHPPQKNLDHGFPPSTSPPQCSPAQFSGESRLSDNSLWPGGLPLSGPISCSATDSSPRRVSDAMLPPPLRRPRRQNSPSQSSHPTSSHHPTARAAARRASRLPRPFPGTTHADRADASASAPITSRSSRSRSSAKTRSGSRRSHGSNPRRPRGSLPPSWTQQSTSTSRKALPQPPFVRAATRWCTTTARSRCRRIPRLTR